MASDTTTYIVDDSEFDRFATAKILIKCGLQVEEYADAESFLAAFDPMRVGCLLLDIRMPGFDGPELHERMIAQGVRTPIIFVSGVANIATATEAMRRGAFDVMEKPLDSERLFESVQKALLHSREGLEKQRMSLSTRQELQTLTPKEKEVLPYICAGQSLKQITAKFGVDFTTAARHQSRILDKLNTASPMQLLKKLQQAEISMELV